MCGRYTLTVTLGDLLDEFGIVEIPFEYRPRYNIAPGQEAPVVVAPEGRGRMELFRWGLVPFWADDPAIGSRLINARAETASRKPSFRHAFQRRRCLVPADGFYEWKREGGRKVPHWIRLPSGRPFAFAGLWDRWAPPDGEPLRTFTILTTEATERLRPIHPRMPVVLSREARRVWLDPAASPEALAALLRPYAEEELEARPVSTFVNSPRNEGPRCVAPVDGE